MSEQKDEIHDSGAPSDDDISNEADVVSDDERVDSDS